MRSAIKKSHFLGAIAKVVGRAWPVFLLPTTIFAQDQIMPEQILTKLDRIRQPNRSFAVNITVSEFREGKKDHEATLRMYARKVGAGFDSLTVCLSPAADQNKLVLARGDKLWFYDPKSARP